MRNNTTETLEINENDTFVTLIFHKLKTPTKSIHDNPPYRLDILKSQLDKNKILKDLKNKSDEYLKKLLLTYKESDIALQIQEIIRIKTKPFYNKVADAVRGWIIKKRLNFM